jgi:hypothetical protein
MQSRGYWMGEDILAVVSNIRLYLKQTCLTRTETRHVSDMVI